VSLPQQGETLLASNDRALTGFWPGDQFTEAFTEGAFYTLGLSRLRLNTYGFDARVGIGRLKRRFLLKMPRFTDEPSTTPLLPDSALSQHLC
jgi:hypothetical protein